MGEGDMRDFLRFETMITPVLIQIFFWLGVIFSIVVGIGMMVAGDNAAQRVGGLLLFLFGPLAARIYSEILIVWFRMAAHLRQIDLNTRHP
jgi:Domain of unknown function (DUF4282)